MKYVCQVCGYIYDEDQQGTKFENLPEDWKCPLCKAPKSQFRPQEEEAPQPQTDSQSVNRSDESDNAQEKLKELTAGQLAALFTNLARGSEKQYNSEAESLFTKLADYFTSITPAVGSGEVEDLIAMLKEDIDSYPSVRATVDADHDRGAARALVWGEKVTRMMDSLLDRYASEGEAMLEGTRIWVCTACGFIYIGDTPPQTCPVCKVPDWKFEEVEGRAI